MCQQRCCVFSITWQIEKKNINLCWKQSTSFSIWDKQNVVSHQQNCLQIFCYHFDFHFHFHFISFPSRAHKTHRTPHQKHDKISIIQIIKIEKSQRHKICIRWVGKADVSEWNWGGRKMKIEKSEKQIGNGKFFIVWKWPNGACNNTLLVKIWGR